MPKVNQPKPRIVFPSTPINVKPLGQPAAPRSAKLPRAYKIGCGVVAGLVALSLVIGIISFANFNNSQSSVNTDQSANATSTAQAADVAATNVALQNTGPQPTVTLPTDTSTPASQPTLTPIPSANDLDQLLSSYGHVTNVSAPTLDANGDQGVAIDVQVDSPTQSRVKHLAFELAQFFYQRSDIGLINLSFHANGYTGPDDPIAGCGGPAPAGWLGMDESQLWDAMAGAFNANLSA